MLAGDVFGKWCGDRELHSDDVIGNHVCWLLNITTA